MNERMKELYVEATGKDWVYDFDPDIAERFAKLVVKECANHCDLLLVNNISSEWSRATHDCSRAIKKHFGVNDE